ncbi:hypothetical protein STEG23_030166, partial [Scotinomys teguina]
MYGSRQASWREQKAERSHKQRVNRKWVQLMFWVQGLNFQNDCFLTCEHKGLCAPNSKSEMYGNVENIPFGEQSMRYLNRWTRSKAVWTVNGSHYGTLPKPTVGPRELLISQLLM